MISYSKEDLSKLAVETNFIRDNLEKVVRLIDILEFINQKPFLSERLALKGGTAINLIVFEMPRLSVDIDFDYTQNSERDVMLSDKTEIHRIIEGFMLSNNYFVSAQSKNPHTLDSMVFQYTNSVGNLDNIKIEINYGMRCHVLPIVASEIRIPFLKKVSIQTLAPTELFGGKIKALIERCACRDLYDVYNLLKHNKLNNLDKDLLHKIVIFYLAVGGNSLPQKNFDFSTIDSLTYKDIRVSLIPVLRKDEKFPYEEVKQQIKSFLQDLMTLTENETEFIKQFNSGKFQPELLFIESEQIERIKNHPMAIWKMNNLLNR